MKKTEKLLNGGIHSLWEQLSVSDKPCASLSLLFKNESLKNNQDQEKQFRSDIESLRRKETEVTLGYMNLKFDYNIAVSMMNEIYMERNELIEQGKQINYCCIEGIERLNRLNREYIERWGMSQE